MSRHTRSISGHGHIDFKKIIETLQGVGYDRWLTMEAFGHEDCDLATALSVDRYDTAVQVYSEALALLRSCL
jgi:D-psicose/D-tagatose/L-ribulose 3-epimerase